ncbi:MAG: class I SAM-dependent methyltransferase [Candidatus Eiseniibacteriota bacterium]
MKDLSEGAGPALPYVLGHSDRELERLSAQARLVEPATRAFFLEAGIVPGMRILDVGSGAGDVAFLATNLTGLDGSVVGVDRVPAAVATARRRAQERSLGNVSFVDGDPAEMTFDEPFDAVVGRYVLLFQNDAARMLRRLARHLRPGGLLVFHEPDWTFVRSVPRAPTYEQCCRWIVEAGIRGGSNWNMGEKLRPTFVDAGFPDPTMRMRTFFGGGEAAREVLHAIAEIAITLLPAMEKFGVATAAEVDVATLADRMWQEVARSNGVIIWRSEIAAWSRVRDGRDA